MLKVGVGGVGIEWARREGAGLNATQRAVPAVASLATLDALCPSACFCRTTALLKPAGLTRPCRGGRGTAHVECWAVDAGVGALGWAQLLKSSVSRWQLRHAWLATPAARQQGRLPGALWRAAGAGKAASTTDQLLAHLVWLCVLPASRDCLGSKGKHHCCPDGCLSRRQQ